MKTRTFFWRALCLTCGVALFGSPFVPLTNASAQATVRIASSVTAEAPSETASRTADEKAREQFNGRWFQTKVPPYLQARKNEEAAYAGPTLPAQEYLEILAHDFKPISGKLSALVDPKVYSSFQHQMNSKYLLETLTRGELTPRSSQIGSNDEETSLEGVYLELHTYAFPKPFAWGDVELHFAATLLDRRDYYVSPFWDFGAYGPFAAAPVVNPSRVAYYITKYLIAREQNEFVFANAVSLGYLTRIVVKRGFKAPLIQALLARKTACPVHVGWDALIVERAANDSLPLRSRRTVEADAKQ